MPKQIGISVTPLAFNDWPKVAEELRISDGVRIRIPGDKVFTAFRNGRNMEIFISENETNTHFDDLVPKGYRMITEEEGACLYVSNIQFKEFLLTKRVRTGSGGRNRAFKKFQEIQESGALKPINSGEFSVLPTEKRAIVEGGVLAVVLSAAGGSLKLDSSWSSIGPVHVAYIQDTDQ
jgi:hypothetical protein